MVGGSWGWVGERGPDTFMNESSIAAPTEESTTELVCPLHPIVIVPRYTFTAERNVPPLVGGDGKLKLKASKASRCIARIRRVKWQINRFIAEHDGKRVGLGAAGNDDGSITRAEVAELLGSRAVDNVAIDEPFEVPLRHR